MGFSLIELLIVVVIFSIIMTLSVGGYRQSVLRTNRSDATSALLRIAAAQERHYLDNNQYAASLAELGIPGTSERGYYQLTIQARDPVTGYQAAARVDADTRQRADHECRAFTIDQSGLRGARSAGDLSPAAATERCWR